MEAPGLDVGVGGGVLREGEDLVEERGGYGGGEEGAGGVVRDDELCRGTRSLFWVGDLGSGMVFILLAVDDGG